MSSIARDAMRPSASSAASPETVTEPTDGLVLGRLDDLLGYQLRRAQVAVFRDFVKTVTSIEGISPGLYGTLILIDANPGLSQTALAQTLGLDRSSLVPVIDGLEKRGLVERRRSTVDRRRHALTLTADGVALLSRLHGLVDDHEARIAGRLTAAERRTLMGLLGRV